MEWTKIDPFGEFLSDGHDRFLIMDEYGNVNVGTNCFDYYDSVYWCPMPRIPFSDTTITNDDFVSLILKHGKGVVNEKK